MRIVLAVVCLMWPGRAFAQGTVLLVGGSDALETALRLELAPQGLACARLQSGTASLTLQEARAHAERHGAHAVIWVAPIEERVHVGHDAVDVGRWRFDGNPVGHVSERG